MLKITAETSRISDTLQVLRIAENPPLLWCWRSPSSKRSNLIIGCQYSSDHAEASQRSVAQTKPQKASTDMLLVQFCVRESLKMEVWPLSSWSTLCALEAVPGVFEGKRPREVGGYSRHRRMSWEEEKSAWTEG